MRSKTAAFAREFQVGVESANKVTLAMFYITNQPTGSFLSYETSIDLGILQLQFISITENANNPLPQATMTFQSPQPDRDLDTDTQRQLQSHAMETTL